MVPMYEDKQAKEEEEDKGQHAESNRLKKGQHGGVARGNLAAGEGAESGMRGS
jgi:hypothetical protein